MMSTENRTQQRPIVGLQDSEASVHANADVMAEGHVAANVGMFQHQARNGVVDTSRTENTKTKIINKVDNSSNITIKNEINRKGCNLL